MTTPEALPDELARAIDLLQVGRRREAAALLSGILRRDPRAGQAWYLLSLAVEDPRQQRDCLQRALRLNPHQHEARERLAQVEGSLEAPPAPVEPPPPAARTDPPAAEARPSGRPAWALWSLVGVSALGAVVCAALAGLYAAGYFAPEPPAVVVVSASTPITFPTLPPTWTPSPVPSATPLPPPTATRTPSPTPTLPPPNPTMRAEMDTIAEQVADLRGLAVQGANPSYLVARSQVEAVLRRLVLSEDLQAELEDQKLVLSSLGLVKPTYDLVRYALNSHADNIGGFYLPWTKEMYVIGSQFGGIERFVYSHEYDHALTDAHFGIDALGVYPLCASNTQRCSAIRALVEGDATLLMEQWWRQYATPQDYADIVDYEPPRQTLPEEFPPPYIQQDLAFPYDYGYEFVSYLYDRGNWAAVNGAYADLPQSTEHILHPEKYLAGEAPVEVALPPLEATLGNGWRRVADDVLGEWMTFLILGYGADVSAQLPDDTARRAAEGWGGDRYQVYHDVEADALLLVARWVWDSQRDTDEFGQAMQQYQAERFRGAQVDRAEGACWEANGQASCLFAQGSAALWVLAPDQMVLNEVLVEFPDY